MSGDNNADTISALLKKMFAAEEKYGCGFYNNKEWLDAYRELKKLV
jgi:hypothetical protein